MDNALSLMSLLGVAQQPTPQTATPAWSPEMEQQFQQWYANLAQQLRLNPDPDDPRHQYDYRAAFAAGAGPDAQSKHWPSAFKMPDHPNRFVQENGRMIDTITGQPVK